LCPEGEKQEILTRGYCHYSDTRVIRKSWSEDSEGKASQSVKIEATRRG
jgi:hypothetical protein